MKLRLESDDVLYLVQELACAMVKRNSSVTASHALNTANAAVQEYLGINIEFVVEGYDGVVYDPLLKAIHEWADE